MPSLILPGDLVRQVNNDGDAPAVGFADIFVGPRIFDGLEIEARALIHHLKDKMLIDAPADSDSLARVFSVAMSPGIDHGLMQRQVDAEFRIDEVLLDERGFHRGIDLGDKTVDLAAVRRAD